MLSDEDVEEIMGSGDRLPVELWGADLSESLMEDPVFDGEKIVDMAGGQHGS